MSSSSPAPMSLPQADGVAVTLVAGAHVVDVSAVASAVRGPHADLLHSGQLELVEGGEAVVDARRLDPRRRARVDAHLVADAVAEHVASLLDDGRRRGVVVEVPVTADARSVALLTGRLLEDVAAEHATEHPVERAAGERATERTADLRAADGPGRTASGDEHRAGGAPGRGAPGTTAAHLPVAGLRHVVSVVRAGELADLVLGRCDGSFLEAERVADLVEHATVVVLTGLVGLPRGERDLVVELVHRLAPAALVLDAGVVLSGASLPERGDVAGLASAAGWMRELSGAGGLPIVGAAVRTWTFRDPRPFHTERLARAVDVDLVPERVGRVLRSKGFVHLATRPDRIGGWSSVGALLSLDPSVLRAFEADAPLGQELVFYGTDLRVDVLEEVLASCLLTPAELLAGPGAWRTGADPFPRWPGE